MIDILTWHLFGVSADDGIRLAPVAESMARAGCCHNGCSSPVAAVALLRARPTDEDVSVFALCETHETRFFEKMDAEIPGRTSEVAAVVTDGVVALAGEA